MEISQNVPQLVKRYYGTTETMEGRKTKKKLACCFESGKRVTRFSERLLKITEKTLFNNVLYFQVDVKSSVIVFGVGLV